MFQTGFLQLGRIRGAPIRIHWSVLLGLLFFSGFRFAPAAWLGFVALILIHELGHALIVLRYGLRVVAVDVHGFGGECRWEGTPTAWQRAVIAWGGVFGQAVLLLGTLGVLYATGAPTTLFGAELASVFVYTNLWLAGVNLLPIPPLDGSKAWSIVSLWKTRRARLAGARQEVQRLEAIDHVPSALNAKDAARLQKLFEDALRSGR
jgi:stage IV sporulation protein FB